MATALGQTPSMRNRRGQHLVHEGLCIDRHHPEGTDDQLTRISAFDGLLHSPGRQHGSQDEHLDVCQHGARQVLADQSTIDSAQITPRTAPMAT